MRVLDGEQFLVRIFLGESDTWHHTPLSRALLERLRALHDEYRADYRAYYDAYATDDSPPMRVR